MIDALTDRVDQGVKRLHGVVDNDAARAMNIGSLGQRRVGANARSHHNQISRNGFAVFEADRCDASPFGVGQQCFCLSLKLEVNAAIFQTFL